MTPADIWQFQIMLTEHCCLACPECALNVPHIKSPEHMQPRHIEALAGRLDGIGEIHLTGGEPLANPLFDALARSVKEIFQPKKYVLDTNAILAPLHVGSLPLFDQIVTTHYTEATYVNSVVRPKIDNAYAIEFLKKNFRGEIHVNEGPHRSRMLRGTRPCAKAEAGVVIYYPDGLVYPCCTGKGVYGATGVPINKEWREAVCRVPIPCHNCFFAEP